MPDSYLIFPMFAMVLLSFSVVIRLFLTRVGAVNAGEIPAGFYLTYQGQSEGAWAAPTNSPIELAPTSPAG